MRVGLLVPLAAPFADRAFVAELARRADASPIDALWVGEHVVLPEVDAGEYPHGTGEVPGAVRNGELEPWSTLAFLAALTERIRLGACTTVPQRNPVYTAKEIANVDWLSAGRVEVGVGVGWSRAEFAAVGVEFAGRGARCDEHLEIMRALWAPGTKASTKSQHRIEGMRCEPRPLQQPHPPLHVLGDSAAALVRAVRVGAGFLPMDKAPDEMAALADTVEISLARAGRSRGEFSLGVLPYSHPSTLDSLRRYHDAGVDRVIVCEFAESREAMVELLERTGELARASERLS